MPFGPRGSGWGAENLNRIDDIHFPAKVTSLTENDPQSTNNDELGHLEPARIFISYLAAFFAPFIAAHFMFGFMGLFLASEPGYAIYISLFLTPFIFVFELVSFIPFVILSLILNRIHKRVSLWLMVLLGFACGYFNYFWFPPKETTHWVSFVDPRGTIVVLGIFGAIGGFAFWATWARLGKQHAKGKSKKKWRE